MKTLALSILALVTGALLVSAPAAAAPRVLKAHCDSAFTANQGGGTVTQTELRLPLGSAAQIDTAPGLKFHVSYGGTLKGDRVLTVTGGIDQDGAPAMISLFIGRAFPDRFDLSLKNAFLSCVVR